MDVGVERDVGVVVIHLIAGHLVDQSVVGAEDDVPAAKSYGECVHLLGLKKEPADPRQQACAMVLSANIHILMDICEVEAT